MDNIPTEAGRTAAMIAAHFARHHDQFVDETLREIAADYQAPVSRTRTGLRKASDQLARQGLVLTIPVRDDGYVVVITNQAREWLIRLMSRLDPTITEYARYEAQAAVVGLPGFFDGFLAALDDMTAKVIDQVINP